MKIFISQKMRNLTEEEILKRRQMLIYLAKSTLLNKIEIIESYHSDFDKNSIAQLGQSIIEMSDAQLVLVSNTSVENIYYTVDNFEQPTSMDNFKGSEIEVFICESYEIPMMIYDFEYDENGSAISARFIDNEQYVDEMIKDFID